MEKKNIPQPEAKEKEVGETNPVKKEVVELQSDSYNFSRNFSKTQKQ